jgi:hypothetical protein
MYRCRRHVLRHPTWNLKTRSQHVFLPHQSCQIYNSSPTQLLFLQNLPLLTQCPSQLKCTIVHHANVRLRQPVDGTSIDVSTTDFKLPTSISSSSFSLIVSQSRRWILVNTEAIPPPLAPPMKKIPLNVAPLKPMPNTRQRKPKAAIIKPSIPSPTVHNLVDTGHTHHQSTQTTLLTVDLAAAIPIHHLYDGLTSDWFNSSSTSSPSAFTDVESLLREHAKEGARAMAAFLLKDLQSWITVTSAKLGQP